MNQSIRIAIVLREDFSNMQKIDIISEEEVYINGAVYRPICGECIYDGSGPSLTVKFQYVRDLNLGPSQLSPSHPAYQKRGRLDQIEERLDKIEGFL